MVLFIEIEFLIVTIVLLIKAPSVPTSKLSLPPKLELQPPEEVWFQKSFVDYNTSDSRIPVNRITLYCHGSNEPDFFEWKKDGKVLNIDGKHIQWQKEKQSGTIIIDDPKSEDEGYYQCSMSNFFGTALTNKVHVVMGVLDHFVPSNIRQIVVNEGDSLTIPCNVPYGNPKPSIFWLYRDAKLNSVIETIRRKHITVDLDGRLHFSFVEPHDSRKNLIYQCAATSPVLHGEYRAGDEVQITVKPKVTTKLKPIHSLYLSPSENVIKVGGKLKLMCIFGGKPLPVITWKKRNEAGVWEDIKIDDANNGKSLVIENIRPSDSGHYRCSSQHIKHDMKVIVTTSPYWINEPPKDLNETEDSTGELTCDVSGFPQPIIRWYQNGSPIHNTDDDGRKMILDNGRRLRIYDLHHDTDTSVYQCNASNIYGYVYANAYINVAAHAPIFRMSTKRVWKVIQNSDVDMSCEIDAAPEANVKWVDEHDQPLQNIPGKLKILSNHTLRIMKINSADEGLYYCNVSNRYGINRASNKLEVFNPTYFTRVPSPKRLVVEANETVELFCGAIADPRLLVDYVWTHDGKPLQLPTTTDSNGVNRLKFDHVRGKDSGNIDCAAVTDVEVKVAGIELLVRDVPNPPIIQQFVCDDVAASINWKKPSENGDEIRKFIIQFSTSFMDGNWTTAYEELNTERDHYFTKISLSPWVDYKFRIIAINSYGESEPGYPHKTECKTKPSRPYINPGNVMAEGNEPNNIVVYWDPIDKYDWNGPNMRYLIRYKINEPYNEWREFIIEDPLANYTIIRDQPTFKQYQVQVKSVNDFGDCIIEPDIIIGYSGENAPKEPVSGLKVQNIYNYSSVEISWDPYLIDNVRGHFKGYKIVYWNIEKSDQKTEISVSNRQTNYIINDLKAITTYNVTVKISNKHYDSAESEIISFYTPEGIPSKVHNFKARAVGFSSVLLTWETPLHTNGRIRGYFITIQQSFDGEIEETYVLHRQTYYLHEHLLPDTLYKVAVWAETYGGEGPKIIRPIKTFPLSDPDMPDFELTNKGLGYVEVTWKHSNKSYWGMSGSSFSVEYTNDQDDEWKQSISISLPHDTVHLENLGEDIEYYVIGISRDGDRVKKSLPKTIRTRGRSRLSHINRENLQKAMWFIAVLIALFMSLFTLCCLCYITQKRSGIYSVKKREIEKGHTMLSESEYAKFLECQFGVEQRSNSMQKVIVT
uniref:Neuroglian (inferred by orthology to a D. melanogaster protein) n=1 Tax=Strongyloides venezuelensis TaxID=75913 RepID=A0A0K0FH30_STRVS